MFIKKAPKTTFNFISCIVSRHHIQHKKFPRNTTWLKISVLICSSAIYTSGDLLANGNAHFIRFHTIPQRLQIELFSKSAAA